MNYRKVRHEKSPDNRLSLVIRAFVSRVHCVSGLKSGPILTQLCAYVNMSLAFLQPFLLRQDATALFTMKETVCKSFVKISKALLTVAHYDWLRASLSFTTTFTLHMLLLSFLY